MPLIDLHTNTSVFTTWSFAQLGSGQLAVQGGQTLIKVTGV